MGAKLNVLGLIMPFFLYLRSAMVRFPLSINRITLETLQIKFYWKCCAIFTALAFWASSVSQLRYWSVRVAWQSDQIWASYFLQLWEESSQLSIRPTGSRADRDL